MDSATIETAYGSQGPEAACGYDAYSSYPELLEAKWEELVIKFDQEKGKHVVRTACCPMAPVC